MEVLNDLVGFKNLKIYQNTDWFSFSLDSILLPNFVRFPKGVQKIIDLGTGNMPIPLVLSTKTSASIVAVEIQEDVYRLAKKTLEYNRLENQISLFHMDMLDLKKMYMPGSFDVVLSNPPYFKYSNQSNINDDIHKTIARHEKTITLEQLIDVASYLLKNHGIFALVHRTERLVEIIELCKKKQIFIKRIQFVYPKRETESNLVLIEGIKNGRNGLKVLQPLYIHNDDGSYLPEILKMFE